MRIVVIGSTGLIGKAVVHALGTKHDLVLIGHRTGGAHTVDIESADSITRLFQVIGNADALICAAGQAKFAPLDYLTDEDFHLGLRNKLMGQVNLVRLGHPFLADGGSFTLTGGLLAQKPMPGSAAISLVNAALEGFVRAAALELSRGIRINIVRPAWVSESLEKMGMDPADGTPASKVALAYVRSVNGSMTGAIIEP
jgi:NAD(P)-dependent dehydrogenase (short-subunit alcohol dehydrogenase family)